MNGSDPSEPNWTAVFNSAHRRVFWRVSLVVGIGAVGAALLTTSSFVANGTIPVAFHNHNKNKTNQESSQTPPHRGHRPPSSTGPTGNPRPRNRKPEHKEPKKHQTTDNKPDCASESKLRNSASTEYEDCPPAKIEAAWSDEGSTSTTGETTPEPSQPAQPDSASPQK